MTDIEENRPYKIGELSERSGLSIRTLRGYEELGIITSARSDGGTRYYGEPELVIAQLANRMRALSIPVEVIKSIATRRRDFPTGDQSSAALMALLETLSDELRDQAARTLALHDEVTRTIRLLSGCKGCTNKPSPQTCPDCPMETSPEKTGMSQMIWQSS